MNKGTKVLLGAAVAVPIALLTPPTISALGWIPECYGFDHQFLHCLGNLSTSCSLDVSVNSCPAEGKSDITVDQPDLHLCGGHRITWKLTTARYKFANPGGIAFKKPYPGNFTDENPGDRFYLWRMTGQDTGTFDYNVTVVDPSNKSCSYDPRISSE